METLKIKIESLGPLLMHAATFANPLDPATQAHKSLTAKRKKTPEDQLSIAKSEYLGSLYMCSESGPYIPGLNFESCVFEAAKLRKLGKVAKRSVIVREDKIKLVYKGPRDGDSLFSNPSHVDARAVKVGTSKIIRYRPLFSDWSARLEINFNPEQISLDELLDILHDAGTLIGLGDFRPRFGKFTVGVLK